jgi:metal-responsive CopG/Arc/MetJ family transcriptional regulator
MANLTVYRGMKLTKDLALKLEVATREKGFSSPSAFIRAAIENELTSRKPVFDESEERIVATIDRLAQECGKCPQDSRRCSPLWTRSRRRF